MFHGQHGPIEVCFSGEPGPLARALLQADEEVGYSRTDDINGGDLEGCGPSDHMVEKGRRASTATAYLKPRRHLPNLTVWTGVDARQPPHKPRSEGARERG